MPRLLLLTFSLALAACAHIDPAEQAESYRSAELAAFQGADKTYGFKDATVVSDSRQCAIYQGVADDGQTRQIPLRNAQGKPLCRP